MEITAMKSEDVCIFQSGQKVVSDGWYEVVGIKAAKPSAARQKLQIGSIFPNYDGRAVCWLLVEMEGLTQVNSRPDRHLPN